LDRLLVFVLPIFVTAELVDELVRRDELLEVFATICEMNLGGNDGVEPAVDNLPDAFCSWSAIVFPPTSTRVHAFEDPRGVVDEDNTERLGVICLEAHNHELDRNIVHICKSEISHVKDEAL
jgi:hypothetical protein